MALLFHYLTMGRDLFIIHFPSCFSYCLFSVNVNMESSALPYFRVVFAIIQILCCFTSSPSVACPLHERNLLLDFKAAVVDDYNRLSSWQGFNCCTNWSGVSCDLRTGHVTRLDLREYYLHGGINSSMFRLAELKHLDLSNNCFNGSFDAPHDGKLKSLIFLYLSCDVEILREFHVSLESLSNLPSLKSLSLYGANISESKNWGEAVGSLSNLQQLTLSACGLGGRIPNSLLNLTSLLRLDLSFNSLSGKIPAWFQNVTAHLLSLDLSWNNNLGGDLSFITAQRKSSLSLTSFDLSYTAMEGQIPSAIGNMSSLQYLGLSGTGIEGEIPLSIGNMSSLQSLGLSDTRIGGEIPLSIVNLSRLVQLDLSYNKLTGVIPPSLDSLSSLETLYLSGNQLNGTIPSTISGLVNLRQLWLDSNSLSGSISLSVFDNLTRLERLSLSYNHLTVNIEPTWIPQFKLFHLGLGTCNLDMIPPFLVTQYGLESLDLSSNSIPTDIPSWIWDLDSLYHLNLSSNQLTGSLPSTLTSPYFDYLDLHNNSLQGALPLLHSPYLVDLSMNQFNGTIPTEIGAYLASTQFLSLSRNNLSGAIPVSICTSQLQILDLSKNMLSSTIPSNLTRNCSDLSVLDLANNQLKGGMPTNWANLKEIHTLKLNGNYLTGVIPSSISKCPSLQVLDLGNNDFEGVIPHWIGKLSELHVLLLRSNRFHGSIPRQIIGLPNLQILDLSGNHLSGPIPSNLTYLLAMVNASQSNPNHLEEDANNAGTYTNQITISWKGWDAEFVKVLFILKCIDLSNNNFSGSIPLEMGSLKGLIALNLSRNHLSGRIPKTLGGMEQLESLDLSLNRLSGSIPLELQLLSYLQFLNLSFNMQLDGKVPHGGQLLTFGESSYLGNPRLSGIPFTNISVCNNSSGNENCTKVETIGDAESSDGEMIGWAVGLGLSYGLGFSIVIGILTFNMRARKRAFNLYDVVILAIDRCVSGGNR